MSGVRVLDERELVHDLNTGAGRLNYWVCRVVVFMCSTSSYKGIDI